MASCDPSTLLSDAKCFLALDAKSIQGIRLVILCAIRNGDTISCDIESLLEQAKCIIAGMSSVEMAAAEIKILCDIAAP